VALRRPSRASPQAARCGPLPSRRRSQIRRQLAHPSRRYIAGICEDVRVLKTPPQAPRELLGGAVDTHRTRRMHRPDADLPRTAPAISPPPVRRSLQSAPTTPVPPAATSRPVTHPDHRPGEPAGPAAQATRRRDQRVLAGRITGIAKSQARHMQRVLERYRLCSHGGGAAGIGRGPRHVTAPRGRDPAPRSSAGRSPAPKPRAAIRAVDHFTAWPRTTFRPSPRPAHWPVQRAAEGGPGAG
jgi:hypothetical protein